MLEAKQEFLKEQCQSGRGPLIDQLHSGLKFQKKSSTVSCIHSGRRRGYPFPHYDALVVRVVVARNQLNPMLIDNSSYINVFLELLLIK